MSDNCRSGCACHQCMGQSESERVARLGGEQSPDAVDLEVEALRAEVTRLRRLLRITESGLRRAVSDSIRERDSWQRLAEQTADTLARFVLAHGHAVPPKPSECSHNPIWPPEGPGLHRFRCYSCGFQAVWTRGEWQPLRGPNVDGDAEDLP